ncbi:hypothetical protein CON39_11500 [Bacillus thuringiensis]|uniref:hypothetical protein n=1 Tax=Bacillus thuringiensis TaxID=1428 RepID=UPI000BED650D|nr:hypothetical protein [Bacillus thuringiensis]PEF30294.1 hypothetical protein CON39_11500 [Bacillus thuringiensis]
MTIKLSELHVPQGEERKIREYVKSPQGMIEIYEPTVKDADAILDLQRGENPNFANSETLRLSGKTVLKALFPMLTNISVEGMSDEELDNAIENPSIHFLLAQKYVSQIVSEVNKLYTEHIKDEIAKADSLISQTELIDSIPSMILEQAKRDPELADIANKVLNSREELEKRVGEAESEIKVMATEIPTLVTQTDYE